MGRKIVRERFFKKRGYMLVTELLSGEEAGGGKPFEMVSAFVLNEDGSKGAYIGDSKWAYRLAARGIVPEMRTPESGVCSIGFCEKEQQWYGWNHRAIYGFGIGSTCSKGDCHYRAANLEDEIEGAIRFWSDPGHEDVKAEVVEPGQIKVSWTYNDTVKNESIRGTISGVSHHYDPENFGRGVWTAETINDCRQMAMDFAEGVS